MRMYFPACSDGNLVLGQSIMNMWQYQLWKWLFLSSARVTSWVEGKSWDSSKCWRLQTLQATWKQTETWVDVIRFSLIPHALLLLEGWAQCYWSDAVCLAEIEGLQTLLFFLSMPVERFICFTGAELDPGNCCCSLCWDENCIPMRASKTSGPLKKKKVLFLHIQEQLCQAMWIVCVAKMFHEHFDFVTTKGHLPTHKCTFHTNHHQHYTG